MNKRKGLLALLCALVALAALYAVLSITKNNAEKQKAEQEASESAITSAVGVREIAITEDGLTRSFTNADGQWICDQHTDWPIRQSDIAAMQSAIESLSAVRVLEQHEALSEYGLDSPHMSIEYTDESGGHTLLASPGASEWYVALSGDERVFTVDSAFTNTLDKSLLELVDYKTVPELDVSNVNSIVLQKSGVSYEYTKTSFEDDSASWSCKKDGVECETVVNENVSSAVYDIAQLSFTGCAAYDPTADTLSECGFDEPLAALSVGYTDSAGEPQSFTLVFGAATAEDSGELYARFDSDKALVTCKSEGVESLTSLLQSV